MLIVCVCGKTRTAQPWKNNKVVQVNACFYCKPSPVPAKPSVSSADTKIKLKLKAHVVKR